MAEFLFATAWAAGVVEGTSVLRHAATNKDEQNDEISSSSSPTLLLPSLLYGTFTLPLSFFGASPGPSLVSAFPFAPPISALMESSSAAPPTAAGISASSQKVVRVVPTRPKSTGTTAEASSAGNKRESNDADAVSNTGDEQQHPIISLRSEMIRKVREDNRRALAARRQQQKKQQQHRHLPRPPAPSTTTTRQKAVVAPRNLFATLDGRPLATPLAEAMRRTRCILFGAGLVLSMVSYHEFREKERRQQETLQREKRQQGRDVDAIQQLVKRGERSDGVVLRVVDQPGAIKNVASSKGDVVVPVLYSVEGPNDDPSLARTTTTTKNDDSTYWNLGASPKEWLQTPLTKDWLLRATRDNHDHASRLVIEADVSSSSLSDYLSLHDKPNHNNKVDSAAMESAMAASRILGMIAKQKGVLLDSTGAENALVSVLIGSVASTRPPRLVDTMIIYIHGPTVVGSHLSSILERLFPKAAAADDELQEKAKLSDAKGASEIEDQPTTALAVFMKPVNNTLSLLDYIGMKLRKGCTNALTALTTIFAKNDNKTVYVLSDGAFAVDWLRRTPTHGWNVRGHDALSDLDAYYSAIATKRGITFLCCENDETTCALMYWLLVDEKSSKEGPYVVLVQEESCASVLRDVVSESNQETTVEIVSVKEIHANLFDNVRELLARDNSPIEVEKMIDATTL